MHNVKLKPRLKDVTPGEDLAIARGLTKEVLRARVGAMIKKV